MASSIIQKPVKYFDVELAEETYPVGSHLRFDVSLQTGETNINNRIGVFPIDLTAYYCAINGNGRITVVNYGNATETRKVMIRVFYIN